MLPQEQAFKASMSDAELLAVVKNRISFIPAAQNLLIDELCRRQLSLPVDSAAARSHSPTLFTRLRQMIGRKKLSSSDPAPTEKNSVQRH